MAFRSRELSGYTTGRISDVNIHGKPTEVQLAFSGYKTSIEAFVHATITKQKVLVNAPAFPIPPSYEPTVPLPLPRVIFKLRPAITAGQALKLEGNLAQEGIQRVEVGKGTNSYTLDNPSFKTLARTLPVIAFPEAARIDGYAQAEAVHRLLPVYQFIDGFLATNTYPYKKADFPGSGHNDSELHSLNTELRLEKMWYRPGFGEKKPKKTKLAEGEATTRDGGEMEKTDLTPTLTGIGSTSQSVLVAKPSPLPSSTSWGSVNSCPFLPGLIFPYFPGLLYNDQQGVRDLICKHIFRNLGSSFDSAKPAYVDLRKTLGVAVNTVEGVILSHVLKGIDLALDTQSQLYLLFDKKTYLGFCLLGAEFSIFAHGRWINPVTAEELQLSLRKLRTSSAAKERLVELFKRCKDEGGDIIEVSMDDIDTPLGLAENLARVKVFVGEGDESIEEEIRTLIGQMNFPVNYKTITPENVKWALEQLALPEDSTPDYELARYVPLRGWRGLDSREYQVLSCFGSRSLSFRNAKGEEFRVVKPGEGGALRKKKEGSEDFVHPCIIVYEKALTEAMEDFRTFKGTGRIRVDYVERAGSVRAHKYYTTKREIVVAALEEFAKVDGFGEFGLAPGEEAIVGGKKRKRDDGIAVPDDLFDSLF